MMTIVVATVGVTADARAIVGMTGRMTKIIIGIRGSATTTTTTFPSHPQPPPIPLRAAFGLRPQLFVPGIARGCRRRSALSHCPKSPCETCPVSDVDASRRARKGHEPLVPARRWAVRAESPHLLAVQSADGLPCAWVFRA
jgi:hypothetical protein